MDRFKAARDKGGEYLLKQVRADGSFGNVSNGVYEYYKVPAALQVCGETGAANRLCNWIRRNGMTPDGDFGHRKQGFFEYAYSYFNIWVIIGAHRLGQFDLSQRGMDFLMDFYAPENGGFYSSPDERAETTLQDLWVTSGCGQAALYTGRMEPSLGVGRWMKAMMDQQPDYPRAMYTVMNRKQGLITEPDTNDEIRYILKNVNEGDQFFFHPGIAGGFLARLYQATGDNQWLDLAKKYMVFAERATDHMLHLLRAGKVMWAASVLYTMTGEDRYKNLAIKIADFVIEQQRSDGAWCGMWTSEPNNDTTAEMVVWLDEVYQAVGEG